LTFLLVSIFSKIQFIVVSYFLKDCNNIGWTLIVSLKLIIYLEDSCWYLHILINFNVLERVDYFCLFFLSFLTIWVKGINVIISKWFGNPILNHIDLRPRRLLFSSWVFLVFILCSWKVANIKASFHLNYIHCFSLEDSYPSSIWNYKWRMQSHLYI
jgi:hypothetical protein